MSEETRQSERASAPNPVAAAILATAAQVKRDKENTFADYRYASVDAFYSHVRKPLAENGLTVYQDELSLEIVQVKGAANIQATYEMGWKLDLKRPPKEDCERFTLALPVTGPQSFGSIRSYAKKYWVREQLLLATGEGEDEGDEYPRTDQGGAGGKADGEWVFDPDTLEVAELGTFASEADRAIKLFTLLDSKVFPKMARPTKGQVQRLQQIYNKNRPVLANLQQRARKPIAKKLEAMGIDLDPDGEGKPSSESAKKEGEASEGN